MKLQASPCSFIKKETLTQVLSYEFCEISKKTVFAEHLLDTASMKTSEVSTLAGSHSHKQKACGTLRRARINRSNTIRLLM